MSNPKFCANCGNQLAENEKFCGKCGTPLAETTPDTQPQANVNQVQYTQPAEAGAAFVQAEKKPNPVGEFFKKIVDMCKKDIKIPIIAGAALVAIIVAIIVIVNITKYQVINAKELFEVKFEGVNSCGTIPTDDDGYLNGYDALTYGISSSTASDALNALGDVLGTDLGKVSSSASSYYDKLDKEYSPYLAMGEKALLAAYTKASDTEEAEEMRNAILNAKSNLKIKFDKTENLSNGDKVKCTVTYDADFLKKYNVKLTGTEFEIEVKGLEEGESISLFDGLKVTFNGFNGTGSLSFDTADSSRYIYYNCDTQSNLSNGDKVTVTAELSSANKSGDKFWFQDYDTDKYYVVDKEKDTKEYTVEGLSDAVAIDAFEGISFTYDYGVPYLRVRGVDTDKLTEDQKKLSYSVEDNKDLKVGDTFTVKVDEGWGLEDGYTIKDADADGVATKTFTVDETYPTYVTVSNAAAANATFDEAFANKIIAERQSLKGSSYVSGVDIDGSIKSISSFDVSAQYVENNDVTAVDNIGWNQTKNAVFRLYKVEVALKDGEKSSQTFYCVMYIYDVLQNTDGTFTANDNINVEYFGKKADAVESITGDEGYTVKEFEQTASTPATDNNAADDTSSELVP